MGNPIIITSVIAHIDHGKTTIIDSLIASQGFFSNSLAGDLRYLDSRQDEQERGITLKLTPIKLKNGHIFLDTPGHVDFESLIFSSSILSDNYLVVIDANEGITPRFYSLVKFIDKDRSVLILNKIDKIDSFDEVELIVHKINGLMGKEVFQWTKNNIILSSAILCAGLCYGNFSFSSKNTFAVAFKAFKSLENKIEKNEVSEILKKYKIKYFSKKNVFSTLMPLADAIYNTVDHIYTKNNINDNLLLKIKQLDISGQNNSKYLLENKFYSIESKTIPAFIGICIYNILKEKNKYFRDNLLFVTRIFNGTIKKGDKIYNTNGTISKEVTVEHIFEFFIDTYEEVETAAGPTIIFLQGDFLKNSVISSDPVKFNLKDFLTPFYRSKLILNDFEQLNDIKDTIRVMSFTEPNLKVRLNKYSELEFKCSGNVQFEKICFDLKLSGFDFEIKPPKKEFFEFAKTTKKCIFNDDKSDLEIIIGPIDEFKDKIEILKLNAKNDSENLLKHNIEHNNFYLIQSKDNSHIIESVLDIFISNGPLINEKIIDTFFSIKSINEKSLNFFNTFKHGLLETYNQTNPSICPLYFNISLSLSEKYLGTIYSMLQKYLYIMIEENFNEETNFHIIDCKIPQFIFNDFVNELRVKSKGTAYLQVNGYEYSLLNDFYYMVDSIRKDKGMYHGEKIVENPEKQRTLRK